MYVPCGKCAFCLATRRSDWSTRVQYEHKLHDGASFVTLTYADSSLVVKRGRPQLVKSDLQKWFKRVRRAGFAFRYYAVGEYGSRTLRPHYHVLVFGSVPEDVIRSSWTKGIVHIGKVNAKTINYCLKYVVNSKGRFMRSGRVAPFALMSRKPGLGANYLTKAMVRWHQSGRKNYCLVDGEKRHLPRFYKEKIFSKLDRVRIAVRDGRKAEDSLRKRLLEIDVPVSSEYPLGALSYHEHQLRIAASRVLDKHRKNLTI